jgi:biopolymer transport protein ExbB
MQGTFTEITPWHLFLTGGPLMWPILLCSFVSMTIVIERFHYYFSTRIDPAALNARILACLKENNIRAAVALCEAVNAPTAVVLKAGLLKFGAPKDRALEAMQEAARSEVPRLEERLQVLSVVGNLAPLLGLLGTVAGMAVSFHVIQMRAAAMNPVTTGDIAGGIWQALITTMAGLLVAVPTLLAYYFFASHVLRQTVMMERAAGELADFMDEVARGTHDESEGL